MTVPRTFDTREFRQTLGTFTTGVTIITARGADGEPVGITVNSFNSVSLDPPLVLWSLARSAKSLPAFEGAEHWAVHILSAEQEALSNRFARSGEDKFSGVDTEAGVGGVPLLTGCTSRLQCRTTFRYDGGDHVILVGEVLGFDRADVAPLVFHGGRYAVAARKTDASLAGAAPVPDAPTGFGEDFLAYLVTRAHHQLYASLRQQLRPLGLADSEWFVLSSLTARNGRSVADLDEMYRITGGRINEPVLGSLQSRGYVENGTDGTLELTEAGREVALHVLSAAKAHESELVSRLGATDAVALKHLLRQLIQLTDPGLPDMWGRR